MKRAAILLALVPSLAWAQGGPLQQGGAVTPGHVPVFTTNGVVGDGGSAQNGKVKEIGITNSGTPFCINDADTSGPYHQLCLGANSLGNGIVSYQAYNGAPVQSLLCNINGVIVPCELSASNVQNLPGPLSVAGNLSVAGGGEFGGGLGVQGSLSVAGGINSLGADGIASSGPISTAGNLNVGGTSTVQFLGANGGLDVTGIVPGSAYSLVVNGDSYAYGSSQIDGNLGVGGTTTVQFLGANGGLDVAGTVPGSTDSLVVNGNTYAYGSSQIDGNLIVNGLNSVFRQGLVVNAAPGLLVALETNGDLEIFGDAFANSWQINSDRRLKTDIEDFKIRGIDAVKKLRPVSFRFGAGPQHHGLLADEVQKVVKEAVSERNGVKTLDPMALIDVLITANRELAERVEALEKRVK